MADPTPTRAEIVALLKEAITVLAKIRTIANLSEPGTPLREVYILSRTGTRLDSALASLAREIRAAIRPEQSITIEALDELAALAQTNRRAI